MNYLRIPFDPCNPGQYFACCGLLELFDMEGLKCESQFELDERKPRHGHFHLRAQAQLNLAAVLDDLRTCSWKVVEHPDGAVKPLLFQLKRGDLLLDWWFDEFLERTRDLKCWAGQVTTEKLATELLPAMDSSVELEILFQTPKMMKTKFGIDPRSAWNALSVGFSPNVQGKDAATFPIVELLGAIGLQGFRPNTNSRANVAINYWSSWLPRITARRAAILPWAGLPTQTYAFQIEKRGQSYKYCTFASQVKGKSNEF